MGVVTGKSGKRHVVIIGAGFGGLYAARALKRAPVEITFAVMSERAWAYFTFQRAARLITGDMDALYSGPPKR